MITSFLNSVDLPSVSGRNSDSGALAGIAYEAGIVNSAILYTLPTTALGGTYTLITLSVGGNTTGRVRIDKSYSGKSLGFINESNRSSFLFTYTSGGGGTASITATANFTDNVGPVQRRKVQGYEA
jgi:hypothetical protein